MRKLSVLLLIVMLFLLGCTNDDERQSSEQNQQPTNDESLSLLSPKRLLTIAHRGASGHAPEHTMEAYRLGEQMNGDYIEIDLQMTKNGTLVALHDADLSRTADYEAFVNELTIDEVKKLDVGSWFNEQFPHLAKEDFTGLTVPTLNEVIVEFGMDAHYYIETKQPEEEPDMVEELITVLNNHDLIGPDIEEGHVIIQSFSQESLHEVHSLEPSLPIIQLISYQSKAQITDTELDEIKQYAIGIGANYSHLSEQYVEQVRDADLLLHPYTVNEKNDMKRLIDWGVTGMFTNYPDRLHEVLAE